MRLKFYVAFLGVILFTGLPLRLSSQEQITLEKVFKDRLFSEKTIDDFTSLNDGEHYTLLDDYRRIEKFNYKTGEREKVIFDVDLIESPIIPYIYTYEFNQAENKILFSSMVDFIYRRSYKAYYYIYDMEKGKVQLLDEQKVRNAVFSPDGKYISYIKNRNLYIYSFNNNEHIQITSDGKENEIINGFPDWVYEEEFGFNKAYHWSPKGDKIAFYRFDETNVKEYLLSKTPKEDLYPQLYTYKYPKAGEENAKVEVFVYSLQEKQTIKMDMGTEKDVYFPRMKWTNNNDQLAIMKLNRAQNEIQVLVADVGSGKCKELYHENTTTYIQEVDDDFIHFVGMENDFIIRSEKEGFRQWYYYDGSGQEKSVLAAGEYDVEELLAVNEEAKQVYFSSYTQSPMQTAVYSIGFDGKELRKISIKNGVNTMQFSKGYKYYILHHSSANVPVRITIHDKSGERLRVLEDNNELKELMKKHDFAQAEFFSFNGNGTELNGYLIKPADFDENKKYPLLMYVYGGPESQMVRDEYGNFNAWMQLLAQKGYVIACVDNRGTNGRGEYFRKSTYMQLGKLETEDQIEAARYLSTFNYIDQDRIGIFGWSYGGYMTLLCMMKGNGIFKMGIAVAPVTNWRFYDTIYTERFMKTPQENPSGYDDNSPIQYASQLQGKLLLVHGSGDDNVHIQNTFIMVNELILHNKSYDMLVYPGRQHGIYKDNARLHVHQQMTDYILENL